MNESNDCINRGGYGGKLYVPFHRWAGWRARHGREITDDGPQAAAKANLEASRRSPMGKAGAGVSATLLRGYPFAVLTADGKLFCSPK
jgi:hypothetical protein